MLNKYTNGANKLSRQVSKRITAIDTFVQLVVRSRTKEPSHVTAPWLRNRLDYLGPTFVKLGQIASSRKDIVGNDMAQGLRGLQDDVKPMESSEVDTLIVNIKEWSKGTVSEIQRTPIATASMGQIHRGKLSDGTDIVLKLRRPRLSDDIADDLAFLNSIARFLSFMRVPDADGLDNILKDVEMYMTQESDFQNETRNLIDLAAIYPNKTDNGYAVVPKVYPNLTTDAWIVMDYVGNSGFAFQDRQQARDFVRKLMTTFIKQLMDYGIIHGDPHHGNIGRTKQGHVVLYDCGNVIRLDEKERFMLKELVYLLIAKNKYEVARMLPSLGIKIVDKEKLHEYIDKYVEYLETIDYKRLAEMYDPNASVPIKLEGKLLRIIKVFGLLEGICKELDPDFNYFQLMDVYVSETLLDEDFLVFKISQDMKRLQSWPTAFFSRFD